MLNAAEHPTTARWLPYATLTGAVDIFSIGAVFVRMAQAEHVPSLVIAALRYLFATLMISPFLLARSRLESRRIPAREYGLIGLAGMTFVLSLEHTTILIASLFTNTHPLWVALVEVVLLKMMLALGGGALFATAGLDAASGMGANPLTGVLFALGSAFLSTVYFILGRTVRSRVSTLLFAMLMAALATGTALTGYSISADLWTLLVTYTLAQVILSAVFAFLAFHEQPGIIQIIASAVILAGVGLVVMRGAAPRRSLLHVSCPPA